MADVLIQLCEGPTAPGQRGTIYFPTVMVMPAPVIEPPPDKTPEETFLSLLKSDRRQRRPSLTWCKELAAAARWRCEDIIKHNYWAHCNPFGVCPNLVARNFGCNLPDNYSDDANYIESLAAGTASAAVIIDALGKSESHRKHIWGESAFYRQQTHVGVAMVAGGKFGWVWCVLVAPCA